MKIKGKQITLREAAGQGVAGHQGFKRCNCISGCGSQKCACKAVEMLCNSKCHCTNNNKCASIEIWILINS